jgi:hypothetical protein
LATLASKLLKLFLFFVLFLLSVRYIHTYPLPMTIEQQHILILISEKLDVADYELLYIGAMMIIDIIAAIVLYKLIMRIWRVFRRNSAT